MTQDQSWSQYIKDHSSWRPQDWTPKKDYPLKRHPAQSIYILYTYTYQASKKKVYSEICNTRLFIRKLTLGDSQKQPA